MASLTSQTVAASYGKLLITDSNSGLSGTASNIEDGDGTSSPLYLSTTRVGIGQSSPAVELDITGSLNITGTADIAGTTQIGGGYGSTGIDLTSAGVIQANGALTVDGASTLTGAITASSTAAIAGNTTIGGGYGSTGVTLSSAGVVQMNGALTVDGASTLTGAVTASSTMAVAGALTVGGNIDFNSGTIDLSTQTVDVTLNAAVDALNFDSNTLSIDASNNHVGIGTAAPAAPLEVSSAIDTGSTVGADVDCLAIFENTSAADNRAAMIKLKNSHADSDNYFVWDSADDDDSFMYFFDADTGGTPSARMTINSDGFIGIGTPTPSENLHISGAGERGILVTSTDNDSVLELASDTDQGQNSKLIFSSGSSDSKATILYDHHDTPATQKMQFLVGDNAVTAATILGDGKVGIGTDAPATTLDVTGTGRFTSNVDFGASIYVSSGGHIFLDGGSNTYITEVAADEVAIFTGGAERIRVDDAGKVGIGTTVPEQKFEVAESGSAAVIGTFREDADINNTEVIGRLLFQGSDVGVAATRRTGAYIEAKAAADWSASGDYHQPTDINFYTEDAADATSAGTPRMTIADDGNVGIGTDTPTQTLHVSASVSNDTIDEATGLVKFQAGGGNGLLFGTIASTPYSSYIQSAYVADTSVARYPLILNPIGGNVGIGVSDPEGKLEVKYTSSGADAAILIEDITNRDDNPFLQYVNSDGHMGGLKNEGSGATVRTYDTSDVRIKTNIEDAPPVLDKINQIKIRHYNLKTKSDSKPALGVIAQEVNDIFPEKVGKTDDGTGEELPEGTEPWNVSYSWSYELIKAVQELSAKVTALENA